MIKQCICMSILYFVIIAYCSYKDSMGSWKPVSEKGDRNEVKHALMLGGIWSAQITWAQHIGLYKACDYVFRQLCVCVSVCVLDAYRYAFIAGRVNSSLGFEALWRASALRTKFELWHYQKYLIPTPSRPASLASAASNPSRSCSSSPNARDASPARKQNTILFR